MSFSFVFNVIGVESQLLYVIGAVPSGWFESFPWPSGGRMTLRIQGKLDESDCATFVLSGRIRSSTYCTLPACWSKSEGESCWT